MTTDPNHPSSSPRSESNPSADLRSSGTPLSNGKVHGEPQAMESKQMEPKPMEPKPILLAAEDIQRGPDNGRSLLGNRFSWRSPIARAEGNSPPGPISKPLMLFLAIVTMMVGLVIDNFWLGMTGSLVGLAIAIQILWEPLRHILTDLIPNAERPILLGSIFGGLALLGFLKFAGFYAWFGGILGQIGWEIIGTLGEVLGALGQILIAVLAAYIAWRQYIISRDLTIQQNTITQQQTIDSYFQGVSELVLDEEGLLEDWPQERAIAEGRTAAILSSVDASGKAKIIRFLSRARLLTPLRRDRRLGRAILDGSGGYEEDRLHGVRVIDLGVMLAGADLSGTDLRWTDLSEANLIRANLERADLVKTNLSRTILCEANLREADLNGTQFFYGKAEDATPRSRTQPPDYRSGKHTGAVVENADFTGAIQMSEPQRHYCCTWGGSKTRATIPGGCQEIPNKLGR